MKEITRNLPDDKETALVDERPTDVTERVKTFEDAIDELGEEHPYVRFYKKFFGVCEAMDDAHSDMYAYFKLRIICAALNEGWEPDYEYDEEYRYCPGYFLYSREELAEKSGKWKSEHRIISVGGYKVKGYEACANAKPFDMPAYSIVNISSHLCLKNRELANYCGKQFIDLWVDFYLSKK